MTYRSWTLSPGRRGGRPGRGLRSPRWLTGSGARGRQDAGAPRRCARRRAAQWRYLTELIGRLEEKGYARVEPLTAEDVVAAARAPALTKTLDDLVKAVSRRLDNVEDLALKRNSPKSGRWGTYRTFDSLTERWFNDKARFGTAYPELLYRYADDGLPSSAACRPSAPE